MDTVLKTAGILIIGDEILSGRTRDKNTQTLALWLSDLSVYVREARIIPDDRQTIIDAVRDFSQRFDYAFTSGGIGPTEDDITSESIAAAFGRDYGFHPEAQARLEAFYATDDRPFNEARQRMAKMAVDAELIDNPVSVAPGFQVENVFVLPGVPVILEGMLPGLTPRITGGAKVHALSISAPVLEGDIAETLKAIGDEYPELSVGSYPFLRGGKVGVSVVLRGTEAGDLRAAGDQYIRTLKERDIEPFELPVGSSDGSIE